MKSKAGFTLIELMIVVAIVGVLAAVSIPQYQHYVARSQASRVMSEAAALKSMIENCFVHRRYSISAGECDPSAGGSTLVVGAAQNGALLASGTGVRQVTIDAVSNTARIVATFGNQAVGLLVSAGANQLTWSRDANGVWSCSATIPEQYRPKACG